MQQRRRSETARQWKSLRRGWCLGAEQFRNELLEQALQNSTEHHSAAERREGAEEKAQRIVREELAALGWTAKDLRHCPKGDRKKVRIARRLRSETTISLKWIAEHLEMGSWVHAANRIYEEQKGK